MKEPMDFPELKSAFRQTPPAFQAGVEETLRRLRMEKEEQPVKKKMPLALAIALIVMTLLGAACAASLSPTIDWFGWFYGDDFKARLEQGDVAPGNQTTALGDLVYTLNDVVYADGVLYGTGTIAVREGVDAVLMTEDYDVRDPAGYMLYLGEEQIPQDAPSYQKLAQERNCKILLGKVVPNGYWLNDEHYIGDNGYTLVPQQNGTIAFAFEIYVDSGDPAATALPGDAAVDEGNQDGAANLGIQRDQAYTVCLHIANWEVTPEGEWLREEPDNTWLREEWNVTVIPEIQ